MLCQGNLIRSYSNSVLSMESPRVNGLNFIRLHGDSVLLMQSILGNIASSA